MKSSKINLTIFSLIFILGITLILRALTVVVYEFITYNSEFFTVTLKNFIINNNGVISLIISAIIYLIIVERVGSNYKPNKKA